MKSLINNKQLLIVKKTDHNIRAKLDHRAHIRQRMRETIVE